jgi:hypothetical protein
MKSTIEDHTFNSDLLLNPGDPEKEKPSDLELAARKYGTIFHVLDHDELRDLFLEYEGPANEAKSRARKSGTWGIILIACSLVLAAIEPVGDKLLNENGRRILIGISVLLGIGGCFKLGMGALFAGRKCEWLYQRLMTERIREFYFQTFVFRLPEILWSLKKQGDFKKDHRDAWFEKFKLRFAGPLKFEFEKTLHNDTDAFIWLHETETERIKIPESNELGSLRPLFDAYRELRIRHQISYANYKLKEDGFSKPGRQAEFFWRASVICMALLLLIHVGVLFGIGLPGVESWPVIKIRNVTVPFIEIMTMATFLIAIVSLAMRAIEQGLQPEREVERYRRYLSDVQTILTRFDAASPIEKPQVMKDMERLSFKEMQDFLICGEKAQFIL